MRSPVAYGCCSVNTAFVMRPFTKCSSRYDSDLDVDKNLKTVRPDMSCSCFRRRPFCLLCLVVSAFIVYMLVCLAKPHRRSHPLGEEIFFTKLLDINDTRNYEYIISGSNICNSLQDSSVFLVVVVETAPDNFAERQTIRSTWGSWVKKFPGIHLAFFLGYTNSTSAQTKILNEKAQYHDIVQESFVDSYRNLSIKSVGVLRWVSTHCRKALYLLKSDDDMFIHIPNLIRYLKKMNYKRTVLGYVIHGAVPVQDPKSKWFTPEDDFPLGTYPDYTSGTAYVISGDIVYELYHMAVHTKMFWLEDIFITGICAKRIKANHVHSTGFTYSKRAVDGCAYKDAFSGHENTMEDLKNIWKDIQNKKC